jgi:hypothetical protein
MRKKNQILTVQEDLSIDLTVHSIPASLIAEFTEKIVHPYFRGNLNAAIQDLIHKAIAEQDFMLSHITHIRNTRDA